MVSIRGLLKQVNRGKVGRTRSREEFWCLPKAIFGISYTGIINKSGKEI